jgi:hypothetical protein
MAHDYAAVATNLVRTEIWSDQLKEILMDTLQGMSYVNWMSNFPDGTTFTIPSLGELTIREVSESEDVVYDAMDTGEFQMTIDRYVESATYITDKAKQDSYYSQQLIASFLPKMRRAMEENIETSIFALANSQTASGANLINGAAHRMVGTGNTNTDIALSDFAKAKFALDKANASQARVAIIDPSQEYTLNTLTGIVDTTYNPKFEGIVQEGFVNSATGLRFSKNVYGFDVYVSNYLPAPVEGAAGTINSVAIPDDTPVCNLFLSVGGDETPFKGAWRQMPNVETERNKDKRRDEYLMNARFGLKLYRPEALVVVVTNSEIV